MPSSQLPPYPRFGECYRAISLALGTKASNRDVDRLARDGDYDWSVLVRMTDELVTAPLSRYADAEFAEIVGAWIRGVHADYQRVVFDVPLPILGRAQVLPVLMEAFVAPEAARLVSQLRDRFGGPDLIGLLSARGGPVAHVLDWLDEHGSTRLSKLAFPSSTEDRAAHEMVEKWRRGPDLPEPASIKRFAAALERTGAVHRGLVANVRRWLLAARALAWADQESAGALTPAMLRSVLTGLPTPDPTPALQRAVLGAASQFVQVRRAADKAYAALLLRSSKTAGDQARAAHAIEVLRNAQDTWDQEGYGHYHLQWLEARWHVLSGKLAAALHHYERAIRLASYRAGAQEKALLEEALLVAAQLRSMPALKRLKQRAVCFGLFVPPPGASFVEGWELNHMAAQFARFFPPEGRFPEADDTQGLPSAGPLVFEKAALDKIKPDTGRPNRSRSLRFPDGQVRRYPQLQLFASLGRADVVRSLLAAGADVNALDDAGGSALLASLQHATKHGNLDVLNELLKHTHSKETLNSVTRRKRLSALLLAVQAGHPEVVAALLTMGADPDVRVDVASQTGLYYVMGVLAGVLQSHKLRQHLLASATTEPDAVQREAFRRYDVQSAGTFGDAGERRRVLDDPRNAALWSEVVNFEVRAQNARHTPESLLAMVDHLLAAGANPNAAHTYPVPGRTPLMLAAELDCVAAFEAMLRFGGDPMLPDASGATCLQIALAFGSARIAEHMRKLNFPASA